MKPRGDHLSFLSFVLLLLCLLPVVASASELTEWQRQEIIRTFLAEKPYVHCVLPRTKDGIKIDGQKVTPSGASAARIVSLAGAAANPGDMVKVTAVKFSHEHIIFEINGGPVKKKSWRDHISIGVNNVDPTAHRTDGDDENTNLVGALVYLSIKNEGGTLTIDQIKDQLAPVLDFKSHTAAEAFEKAVPPLIAAALKNHRALVGMDKQTVIYAKGRPPRRVREERDGQPVEEWIYGEPPRDVEFVRFMGDRAVAIEDMKVDGERVLRTENEVGDYNGAAAAMAANHASTLHPAAMAAPAEPDRPAPSLRLPGEAPIEGTDAGPRSPQPQPAPDPTVNTTQPQQPHPLPE